MTSKSAMALFERGACPLILVVMAMSFWLTKEARFWVFRRKNLGVDQLYFRPPRTPTRAYFWAQLRWAWEGSTLAGRGGKRLHKSGEQEQDSMAFVLDELLEFEKFRSEILPKIRQMLEDGKSPEEILEFGKAMAAAKMLTIALTETDSGKAITAAKDVLDRTGGKAKERIEHEHKLSKLKDEELDSVILSAIGSDDETDTPEH